MATRGHQRSCEGPLIESPQEATRDRQRSCERPPIENPRVRRVAGSIPLPQCPALAALGVLGS
eukprot:450994-Prymnesium_polylepis.1